MRTIFVVNCIDHERRLRVFSGQLLLEECDDTKNKTLTKFPFQKILVLFVIGHVTVTTPLIEKCKRYNVALVVMKPNLRPVFYWAEAAEANFLLRKRQHLFPGDDLSVARVLVRNKIDNQRRTLIKTRKKDALTLEAISQCEAALTTLDDVNDYNKLMGMEGTVAKTYFSAYFQGLNWKGRKARTKCDEMNVVLDIGYTILFNYMESFVRMFGFDLYIGVYHRLWFKRKSLVCDLIEPFRCIIDHAVLLAFNRKQFQKSDFERKDSEYRLKKDCVATYYQVFYKELIDHRMDVFKYVQDYYRCFMGRKSVTAFPHYVF